MMTPTVAVNIVTYNSGVTILACLDSVFAQDFRDFTITVLDNSSTDGTPDLLRAIPQITLIAQNENLGYAAAHNLLIARTTGRYILTLNPDVTLDHAYLGAMVQMLDAHPDVGSAAGCLLRVNSLNDPPTEIDSTGLFMRRNRRQGLRDEQRPIAQAPTGITPIFGPDGAAAFYCRAMLDDIAIGGEVFDSAFFMHKEDVDVCWRAQLRGWESIYVPHAIARHIRGFRPGQRTRVDSTLRFYSVRNRYLLMIKNDRGDHVLHDLLPILIYDIGILGYLLLFERASLRAYNSVWKLRREMLTKRRTIQRTVRVTSTALHRWFMG
jgi:GT2 family glycosyltransferase